MKLDMEMLTRKKFIELANVHGPHCLSIYMPTTRIKTTSKDEIVLKNLLKKARHKLEKYELKENEIDSLIKPPEDLLGDVNFWQHLSHGVVFFIYNDHFDYFIFDEKFEEQIHIADHLYLLPLVNFLNHNYEFFLLSLSANQVKLFRGDWSSIKEIEIEEYVPTHLLEVVGSDYEQKSLQYRTGQGETKSRMFHGQGSGEGMEKQSELKTFFREVNYGIVNLIGKDAEIPMIIAGVERHFPIYREVNEYAQLHSETINGNHEDTHPKELHRKAIDILKKDEIEERQAAKLSFHQLLNEKKSSYNRSDIIRAAYQGQIDTLFVKDGSALWGNYDPKMSVVHIREAPNLSSVDLLNFAAVQTIKNKGKVYLMEENEMPESIKPLNAVYRYPQP